MLEFKDDFAEFSIDHFEHFKFYVVQVFQNYAPSNSNYIEFEF